MKRRALLWVVMRFVILESLGRAALRADIGRDDVAAVLERHAA